MIALLLAAAIAQPELDVALSAAVKRAVERAAPSVVRIDLVGTGNEGPLALTGVVVDAEGRIITSAHPFGKGAGSPVVAFANGERSPAKFIGRDEVFQIALLQVERKSTPVAVAPPSSHRIGAYALSIGRGLSASPTVSLGVVSAVGRVHGKAIQTDAKISPTNYGGPLVDLEGRALGVVVPLSPDDSGMAGTDLYDSGVGFAVSMADVLRSVERIKSGSAGRGLLGLSFRRKKPLDGPLEIEGMAWKSPIEAAGLRRGDRIKSIDGKTIDFYSQFRTAIGKLYAGDSINLNVERAGKPISVVVKSLAKLPVYRPPFLGLRFQEKDGKLIIQGVESPASTTGLKVNDTLIELDGPVKSLGDIESKLKAKTSGDAFALVVERDGRREVKALKSGSWPDSMPAEIPAGAGIATVAKSDVPPMKYWVLTPASPPIALLILAAPAKTDQWKAACQKYGVAVIGSDEQLAGPLLKIVVSAIQQSMRLDARRTAVYAPGAIAQLFAGSLDSIGGIADDDGPISPPPAQPDESTRHLVLRHPGSGSLVEAIKKARDEGVPISEFEIVDKKPESVADAVCRWATGLGRY